MPVELDDLADIMYTSGTTGLPKGVAVRHRNVAMIPNHEPAWTGGGWLHGAPMFTFAGHRFIYNPMKMGLTGFYLPKFDAGRWLAYVETERPTTRILVPAMAELLVAHPDFETADLSSLVAGVDRQRAARARRRCCTLQERLPDATVANSYGMTEAGPAFIVMPKEEITKRIGSVGKPIGPMEIKIVDDDGDELARRARSASCCMRMPGKQREYYKDDGATASTWTDDGWLRTGDLAYLDEDGFLYISGRKKDMIIRGGNNIYATDVEAVLLEHPDVQEAAVVGVPHHGARRRRRRVSSCAPGATLDADDAARVLRRAPRRLQAPAPAPLRRRAPPQRHRQGDEAPAASRRRLTAGAPERLG